MNIEKIKISSTKAFTLIELLVVITIIGILAVWAVAVYTSQIQKARDTTRLNDVKALQSWIEQVYQDSSVYPKWTAWDETDPGITGSGWVQTYVPKLPKDPKNGETCNQASCVYVYTVRADDNNIERGQYEVSTAFENSGNRTSKAQTDGWNDNARLESGNNANIKNMITYCNLWTKMWTTPATSATASTTNCWAWANTSSYFIAWN